LDRSLNNAREAELINGILDGIDASSSEQIRGAVTTFSQVKALLDFQINLIHHAITLVEGDGDER